MPMPYSSRPGSELFLLRLVFVEELSFKAYGIVVVCVPLRALSKCWQSNRKSGHIGVSAYPKLMHGGYFFTAIQLIK